MSAGLGAHAAVCMGRVGTLQVRSPLQDPQGRGTPANSLDVSLWWGGPGQAGGRCNAAWSAQHLPAVLGWAEDSPAQGGQAWDPHAPMFLQCRAAGAEPRQLDGFGCCFARGYAAHVVPAGSPDNSPAGSLAPLPSCTGCQRSPVRSPLPAGTSDPSKHDKRWADRCHYPGHPGL